MTDRLKKTLIGAGISVALAAAVSYGLISQDTANQVQTRADQALTENPSAGEGPGGQTLAPNAPAQPGAGAPAPAPSQPAPQNGSGTAPRP